MILSCCSIKAGDRGIHVQKPPSFSLITTPAERPYGAARGGKYSAPRLPTTSLDFKQ